MSPPNPDITTVFVVATAALVRTNGAGSSFLARQDRAWPQEAAIVNRMQAESSYWRRVAPTNY